MGIFYRIKPLEWKKGTGNPYHKEGEISYSCLGRYTISFWTHRGDRRDVWCVELQKCGDWNCEVWIGARKTLERAKIIAEKHYVEQMEKGLLAQP
ncbi:hypothetical protein LCGC14_0428490 [marine sediment metagenome]|uniref:Uncharacterized protein n=1 Tax=marine sediment metagenome TaxID=412755 RepID=A0A0F9SUW8_9ZZZZ